FVWAIREGKADRLKQLGGPGDVAVESEAAILKMLQNAFTNVAGFRLSSKPTGDGQKYEVRLDADPRPEGPVDDFMKNFNLSFVLEHRSDGWGFGNPPGGSSPK